MEPSSKANRTRNVSYRHLFTFGEENNSSPLPTTGKEHTSRQFTFLDSAVDLFQASHRNDDGDAEQLQHHEQDHHMSEVSQPETGVLQEPQLSIAHHTVENGHKDHDGVLAENGFHAPMSIERRNDEESRDIGHMPEPEYEPPYEEEPAFQLPYDIFSRPGALKDIASQFVRKSRLEQLQEEWGRVDGIRDQMRRDFKIRRQKDIGNMKSRSTNVQLV